jgi:hypothetical protein
MYVRRTGLGKKDISVKPYEQGVGMSCSDFVRNNCQQKNRLDRKLYDAIEERMKSTPQCNLVTIRRNTGLIRKPGESCVPVSQIGDEATGPTVVTGTGACELATNTRMLAWRMQ